MTGYYEGDYGEGFQGLGYCHPSFVTPSSAQAGAGAGAGAGAFPPGSDPSATTDWASAHVESIEADSGVAFVAAKETEGHGPVLADNNNNNNNNETLDPRQKEELLEGQKKRAEVARLQAMDIVRKILHENEQRANKTNQPASNAFGDTNRTASDPDHGYYGPQKGFTNTIDTTPEQQSSTMQFSQQQQHQQQQQHPQPSSSASIENGAQAGRLKAMDILRKFRSDGGPGVKAIDAAAAAAAAHGQGQGQCSEPSFSTTRGNSSHYDHCGPQEPSVVETTGNSSNNYDTHSIQTQPFVPSSLPQSPSPAAASSVTSVVAPIPPWELGRRRRECLDWHEERKKRALIKNLEYVARLEEERLLLQMDQVQQVKSLEQQIDERYHQRLESRLRSRQKNNNIDGSNTINTSGAGIGTKQRRKAEKQRKRATLPASLRKNNNNTNKKASDHYGGGHDGGGSRSVAIYVSNLPTDGSVGDETIRALFGSYGSLRKVHFYVDRTTGKRKNDALVIYSLDDAEDEASFTESICSQVCTQHNRREWPQ